MGDLNMFYGASPLLFQMAKELRENMTETEKQLWSRLSKSQLGVRFKAQHPMSKFIVDFYCHSLKLVIEIDGGIHKFQQEHDKARSEALSQLGLKVIRFKNEEILQNPDNVIAEIKRHLSSYH